MDLYREGGEAIGRLLNYHPEEEPRIWSLVAGVGIWKRRHLSVFKSIWRREHPSEYAVLKQARYQRKRQARQRAAKLEQRREASAEAMLTPNQDLSEGT